MKHLFTAIVLLLIVVCPTVGQNVGIGTADPQVDLDIRNAGSEVGLRLSPSVLLVEGSPISTSTSSASINFQSDTTSVAGLSIRYSHFDNTFFPTSRTIRIIRNNADSTSSSLMSFTTRSEPFGDQIDLFVPSFYHQPLWLLDSTYLKFDDDSEQHSAAGTSLFGSTVIPASPLIQSLLMPHSDTGAIIIPQEGLVLYDSSAHTFQAFDGSGWTKLGQDNDWSKAFFGYYNSNSRFGIGTTVPSNAQLEIRSVGSLSRACNIVNNGNALNGTTYGLFVDNQNGTDGTKIGVFGFSNIEGTGQKIGVYGSTLGAGNKGVYGENNDLAGWGGYFQGRGYFSQNVGIGTTTPGSALHVEGTIEVDQKIQANDLGGIELATDDGITRIQVADNGNIGIGLANPAQKLHINGHTQADGYLYLGAPYNDARIYMKTFDGVQGRVMVKQTGTHDVYMGDVDVTGGNVYIRANGDERMYIDQNGGVSIGTNPGSPSTDGLRVKNLGGGNDALIRADGDGNLYKASPTTKYISVNSHAFTSSSLVFPVETGPLRTVIPGQSSAFAPLTLPHGAVLKKLTIHYDDEISGNLEVKLHGPYNTVNAEVHSFGNGGVGSNSVDFTLTVNNSDRAYYLSASNNGIINETIDLNFVVIEYEE